VLLALLGNAYLGAMLLVIALLADNYRFGRKFKWMREARVL
jgi:hypothetical protein